MTNLDAFTKAYIEAALWSSLDNATESGGDPLDRNYSVTDIAAETLAKMVADCQAFQTDNAELLVDANNLKAGVQSREHEGIYTTEERAGHDFWLTRNGHGAGFWDGDWSEPAATKLTDASHTYGEVDLYIGDDGKIYA